MLVVSLGSFTDRDYLISQEPAAFFTTDHYRDYPTVLVRLRVCGARYYATSWTTPGALG